MVKEKDIFPDPDPDFKDLESLKIEPASDQEALLDQSEAEENKSEG